MSPAVPWHEANQSCLMAALSEVRLALEKLLPDAPVAMDAAGDANRADSDDATSAEDLAASAANHAASAAAQTNTAPLTPEWAAPESVAPAAAAGA